MSANKQTIPTATVDPAASSAGVQLYAKDVSGTKQFFVRASDGTISQITPITTTVVQGSALSDGSDGAVDFDGTSVVLGLTPVGNVYTIGRNIYPTTMRVRAGVTLKCHGWHIMCSGLVTMDANTSVISWNGADGAGQTGGGQIAFTGGMYYGAQQGGIGGASGYGAPGNGGNINPSPFGFTGVGGAGGISGFGGGGGAGGTPGTITNDGANTGGPHYLGQAITCTGFSGATNLWVGGGSGGGGGRGGQTAAGGGGGGGGSWGVLICAGFRTAGLPTGLLGTISSNGGAGGTAPASSDGGGGGGGGGGNLAVYSADGTFPPNVTASGGAGGAGGTTPDTGGAQTTGAPGVAGNDGQVHRFSIF